MLSLRGLLCNSQPIKKRDENSNEFLTRLPDNLGSPKFHPILQREVPEDFEEHMRLLQNQ